MLVVAQPNDRFHPDEIVLDAVSAEGYELTFAVPTGSEGQHRLESETAGFDSGPLEPGQSRRFSFSAEPGTYEFYCRYHADEGMVGTITLR